jgi:hypothetical protein
MGSYKPLWSRKNPRGAQASPSQFKMRSVREASPIIADLPEQWTELLMITRPPWRAPKA